VNLPAHELAVRKENNQKNTKYHDWSDLKGEKEGNIRGPTKPW
jgi:hypothetical protein